MTLHEKLSSEFNLLEKISGYESLDFRKIPASHSMKALKFYYTEDAYKKRHPDFIGQCFGITLDPSNDNKICYMNINHVWFNYISE